MVLDINVLSSLMEHLIFCKVYGTLTVTKQSNAIIISIKLSKQTFQPNRFFASFSNSHVFGLSSILCNNSLQHSLPANSTTTNIKHITCEGSSLIQIGSKIRIHIANESLTGP